MSSCDLRCCRRCRHCCCGMMMKAVGRCYYYCCCCWVLPLFVGYNAAWRKVDRGSFVPCSNQNQICQMGVHKNFLGEIGVSSFLTQSSDSFMCPVGARAGVSGETAGFLHSSVWLQFEWRFNCMSSIRQNVDLEMLHLGVSHCWSSFETEKLGLSS